jgi:hypothetical protein
MLKRSLDSAEPERAYKVVKRDMSCLSAAASRRSATETGAEFSHRRSQGGTFMKPIPAHMQSRYWATGPPSAKPMPTELLESIFNKKSILEGETSEGMEGSLDEQETAKGCSFRFDRKKAKGSRKAHQNETVRRRSTRPQKLQTQKVRAPYELPPSNGTSPFLDAPVEVRDQIYQLLLISKKPIRVINGWAHVYARHRVDVYCDVIYTCKKVSAEAIRVLYSMNKFSYLVRDDLTNPNHRTSAGFLLGFQRPMDIIKYGHLFRHLELLPERNRYGDYYRETVGRAIEILNEIPNLTLHTFSFSIYPRSTHHQFEMSNGEVQRMRSFTFLDWLPRNSVVMRNIEILRTQFVDVTLFTPHGRFLRTRLNMRFSETAMKVVEGTVDIWANDLLAIQARKRKVAEAKDTLRKLRDRIWEICDLNEKYTDRVVAIGQWEQLGEDGQPLGSGAQTTSEQDLSDSTGSGDSLFVRFRQVGGRWKVCRQQSALRSRTASSGSCDSPHMISS